MYGNQKYLRCCECQVQKDPLPPSQEHIYSEWWAVTWWHISYLDNLKRHAVCTAAVKSLQSCLTLCDSRDGSPPGSPIPGILQARTLEWVAISFSNAWKWKVKVNAQSCPTLRNPKDCSPPGSSIHGTFQARVLEWGAIAFSDGACTDQVKQCVHQIGLPRRTSKGQ